MRRYGSLAALALTLCICPFAAPPADAQDFRGGITGRITDAQGGRLPGVTVTATHVATNVVSTATTDSDGSHTSRRARTRSRPSFPVSRNWPGRALR
jgi:hypothetical protein